mgnify:CR=1 FL=1
MKKIAILIFNITLLIILFYGDVNAQDFKKCRKDSESSGNKIKYNLIYDFAS